MNHRHRTAIAGLVAGSALLLACTGGGDAPGRTVSVVAKDAACEPARIDVAVGERIAFEVRNEAKGDREFEGIEGTKIGEVEVPAGKTRTINYTVQQTDKPLKVKCYSAGGPSTIIELVPGAAPAASPGAR
jgi:plastocyanin